MTCEACDGDLEREVVELEVRIANRFVMIRQPGWYCWSCQNARFSAGDLELADRQLIAAGRDRSLERVRAPTARAA